MNQDFIDSADTCLSERLSELLVAYHNNDPTMQTLLADIEAEKQKDKQLPILALLEQQNQLENQYCYSRGLKDAVILWKFLDEEFLKG